MPVILSARAKRFMQMPQLAQQFVQRTAQHESEAARVATEESRLVYRRWQSRRPFVAPRPLRQTTMGAFPNLLTWKRINQGQIEFDRGTLVGQAWYWEIQEIGTGQSARILNPSGSVTVPSQIGREIPPGLVWADGPGGSSHKPMSAKARQEAEQLGSLASANQQLYPAALMGGGYHHRAGRIRKQIKGKHFVRDGGYLGMKTLRESLIEDARKTFR